MVNFLNDGHVIRRAADGHVMPADAARLTLSFGPELTATTTVYRLKGLDADAIVGNDVLLAGRGYRIELHESTGHGILYLGGRCRCGPRRTRS